MNDGASGQGLVAPEGVASMKLIKRNDGFTLIELLVVIAVIAVLAVVGIPNYLRFRLSANEASAIGSVRALSSAQVAFAASCGGGGYATNLAALGTAPTGSVPFISADLAAGAKAGYTFSVANAASAQVMAQAATCNNAGNSYTEFFADAVPTTPGTTGVRYFATNQTGLIKQSMAAITTANFDAATILQ